MTYSFTEIIGATFISLYADEAGNLIMLFNACNIFFSGHQRGSHSIHGYCVFERKTSFEIMDIIKYIFVAKSIRPKNVMFNVLEGTSAMSGKRSGI